MKRKRNRNPDWDPYGVWTPILGAIGLIGGCYVVGRLIGAITSILLL